MEFRCRKEPERALLVHRSLDLEGNVFWKSDGHLCDELHESLFTVAKWSAEECTLEVDGREVAKVSLRLTSSGPVIFSCDFVGTTMGKNT